MFSLCLCLCSHSRTLQRGVWGSVPLTPVYGVTPQGPPPVLGQDQCREMGRASWLSCQGTRGALLYPWHEGKPELQPPLTVKGEAVMLCRLKETTRGSISCPIPAVPSSPHKGQGQPTARRRRRNYFTERNPLPPIPAVPRPCGISFFPHWAGSVCLPRIQNAVRGWEGAQFNL